MKNQIPSCYFCGWKSDVKNTQESLTIIENKAKVRTFRNKPQVLSKGGTLTQIDAIATLTKQFEALGYHIANMQETYDRNQEAVIQLMQNQIEPETITEVVEIASSQSTPLVQPLETPPLSTPKRKENPKLNPCQPLIQSRLQKDKFQAFENPTGQKSCGSTTSQYDHPFLDYEAFCFDVDHQEEKSCGSTTSHSDTSLLEYKSFYFDLSIDTIPPADMSDSRH
nr:hypothetical protein [Tanacetum cinerariifolium]